MLPTMFLNCGRFGNRIHRGHSVDRIANNSVNSCLAHSPGNYGKIPDRTAYSASACAESGNAGSRVWNSRMARPVVIHRRVGPNLRPDRVALGILLGGNGLQSGQRKQGRSDHRTGLVRPEVIHARGTPLFARICLEDIYQFGVEGVLSRCPSRTIRVIFAANSHGNAPVPLYGVPGLRPLRWET